MTVALQFLARYWRLSLLALVALALWLQQSRIDGLRVQLAEKEAAYQGEKAQREQDAREQERALRKVEGEHTRQQQTNLEKFNEKLTAAKIQAADSAHERDIAIGDARRLRKQLADTTSTGTHAVAESDTDACRASKLRLAELGQLAGEAAEALAEGEGLAAEAGQLLKDRELRLDWAAEQMKIDRQAVDSMVVQ